MSNHSLFEWPLLTPTQRTKLLRYAKRALKAQLCLVQKPGSSILHHTLNGQDRHLAMNHYPKGDRIDHATGAQYFYHCHRENYENHEHGHFHCFIRYPHIPKRIKPAPLDDWDKYIDNPMTHLIAIGMNVHGEPIRLFTVNRWITSEIWYNAKHANANLNRFKMTLTHDPYWQPLDQWVEAMLHLFAPQIKWLHQARDEAVLKHGPSVYNDESIEELSSLPIDLNTQIQWLMESPA
jgi:hypothetical protein